MDLLVSQAVLLLVLMQAGSATGLECYTCLDVTTLETNRPAGSPDNALLDAYVNFEFGGVKPPACDAASVVTCSETAATCMTFQADLTGIFNGYHAKTDVLLANCLNPSRKGFENVPQSGCVKNSKAYDAEELEHFLNTTLTDKITGVTCTCSDEPGCNDPTEHRGLYCFECTNVTVLETDRQPNSTVIPMRDKQINIVYGGVDPGYCDGLTVTKCAPHETTCWTFQSVLKGTYYGIKGKADVLEGVCLDRTRPGFTTMPQSGCVANNKAWDLDQWGVFLEFSFTEEVDEVTCTCDDESGCNDPTEHRGLYCYTCIDIHVLETDRPENSTVISVRNKIIQEVFGGQDPGNCSSPSILKCAAGQACLISKSFARGIYYGITGKTWAVHASCWDFSLPGYSDMPESGCVDIAETFDKEETGEMLGITFTDLGGISCRCDSSVCNYPQDYADPKAHMCSSCKLIEAKFGDSDINRQMEINLLTSVFDVNTRRCPFASDERCDVHGACSTLNSTITGTYEGHTGSLVISHHGYMNTDQLAELTTIFDFSDGCTSVTQALLVQLYGDPLMTSFSKVDTVSGRFCFCQADFCNLPSQKQDSDEPKDTAARLEMSTLMFATIIIAKMNPLAF